MILDGTRVRRRGSGPVPKIVERPDQGRCRKRTRTARPAAQHPTDDQQHPRRHELARLAGA